MVFTPFYVTCSACGHCNRPHPSPRQGIRMALQGTLPKCRGRNCGKQLKVDLTNSTRPLVVAVRAEIARAEATWSDNPNAIIH